uniref:Uncharacterized protein n=1 Tax=Populus alba TaxID=43335 RepID=A0A4U5Q611_POPAL|nr:hypothetical protein D5086_0000132480 [Populus alba]
MASYWPARSKPGVSHANQAKAWLACLLKRRALREAGFTEQRLPSSLGSGRITGCTQTNATVIRDQEEGFIGGKTARCCCDGDLGIRGSRKVESHIATKELTIQCPHFITGADADQAQEAGSIQCPRGVPSQVVSLVEALEGGAGGWFHIASPLLAVVEYLAVIKQVHMVRAA